jgi:hypothetical protein
MVSQDTLCVHFVDGVLILLFFHFCILVILINLSNNLVPINLIYKEINLYNKICYHNTRSIVMNCSIVISIIV